MPSMFVDGFLETESTEINEKFDQYRELGKQIMIAKEDMSAATRAIQILEKNKAMPQAHIFQRVEKVFSPRCAYFQTFEKV